MIGKKMIPLPPKKRKRKIGLRRRLGPNERSRTDAKEEGGGRRRLGGLGGSEVQKERKFGGSGKVGRKEETFGGSGKRRGLYTQTQWVGGLKLLMDVMINNQCVTSQKQTFLNK